jgi:hypothetical protein
MSWFTTICMKATFCIILLLFSYSFVSILAHTFTPNESASFISLVDQIKSVLMPILQNDSSNVTAIKEQAQYARMLLTDDVLKELKKRKGKTNFTSTLDEITNGLDQLKNAIKNKESPIKVMEIVHGQFQTKFANCI